MQVWPAIDIRGGNCVRLTQGDYGREQVYGDDPFAVAKRWVDQGARHLHIVDLDGALDGEPINREAILAIATRLDAQVQVGGGVRDNQAVSAYLDGGVDRVIIGTGAMAGERWFRTLCEQFPGRVVLGIDSREGKVATHGWLRTNELDATELAIRFSDLPLAAIVYTDIAVDGTMQGPNLDALGAMQSAARCPIIAAGGVRDSAHIKALAASAVAGVILGRCLYEQTLSLSDALAAATEQAS